MVVYTVGYFLTAAAVGLLNACAQPQGDLDEDRVVGQKEAKDLYGNGR